MVSTAARVGSINVLLSTQLGPGVAGLNAFATAVDRTGASVARNVAGMDRSIHGLNRTMAGINARGLTGITVGALRANTALEQMRGLALAAGVAVGGLVPAALGAGMIRVVDGAHRLSNQLRTVTKDSVELKSTQDALYDVAQRTRSAFDSTVTIYARTARATEHLGLSQQKLLRITETVQKAFAIGGASSAEAQGAAIQLSQGIASDRFSGEEFRSVAENAPVLLRGMATSLGVTIGKLREMAHAGELTADIVTKAILDASKVIDEDFAKTTSTIEQAWVRVGNAVTKYAMDSKTASAGSRAIVGGLNLVTDNMAGLVEITLALGAALAATFAARRMQAVSGWVSGMKAARIETLAAAQANRDYTVTQQAAARQTLASARSAYEMAKANTVQASTRKRLGRELQTAAMADLRATQAATAATMQLATAQRAATAAGITMATAGRAASAVWAFMGGPLGAALLATGVAMYVQGQRAAEAQASAARYADAIKAAGENSAYAAGGIRQAATELAQVAEFATQAQRIVAAKTAADDVAAAFERMDGILFALATGGMSTLVTQMQAVRNGMQDGTMSAEEARAALDRLAMTNPRFAGMIKDFQDLTDQADAAKATAAELGRQIDELDGKQAAVTITIGTRQVVLDDVGAIGKSSRPHALDAKRRPMSDAVRKKLTGELGEQKDDELERLNRSGEASEFTRRLFALDPDEFGRDVKKKRSGGARKTADDRFENSLQALADRTAALVAEREALNLGYAEQLRREEALKLEQEALKQVREEARRKGEQDWQNAELTPGQIEQINSRVGAYVDEAMALKQAKESQEALNTAAGEAGSMFRSLIDGSKEWKDVLVDMIPVVLKLVNSLNVAGGGKGIFGGGILQSFIGGLLGISFHGGGTVGAGGNVVPFPTNAPFAGTFHGGGNFGGKRAKHDEVMALVQKQENIFTDRQTDGVIGALRSGMAGMKDDRSMHITVGVAADGNGNLMPFVKGVAEGAAAAATEKLANAVPTMVDARQKAVSLGRGRA